MVYILHRAVNIKGVPLDYNEGTHTRVQPVMGKDGRAYKIHKHQAETPDGDYYTHRGLSLDLP